MADESGLKFAEFEGVPEFRFTADLGTAEGENIFTEFTIQPTEWEIQEVKEGGQNTFTHQLPGRRKAGKATLKYGLTLRHGLLEWYQDMLDEKFKDIRRDVSVTLMTTGREALVTYNLLQAFPTKVTWAPLKSSGNALAIETLELAYHTLKVEHHKPDK